MTLQPSDHRRCRVIIPCALFLIAAAASPALASGSQAAAPTSTPIANPAIATAKELPVARIDQVFGRAAKHFPDNVVRYEFPRFDLRVFAGKVLLTPELGLNSWVAFRPARRAAAIMTGELVLTTAEADPVLIALRGGKLEITGVNNHLLRDAPRLVYVQFLGIGDAADLAQAVKAALAKTATPLHVKRPPSRESAAPAWAAKVEEIIGRKGEWSDRSLTIGIPRLGPVRVRGEAVAPEMGSMSTMAFVAQGGKVASAGSLIVTANEVNDVVSALENGQISVTAINDHSLAEIPRLFVVRYWALDQPASVANALHAALMHMKLKAPPQSEVR